MLIDRVNLNQLRIFEVVCRHKSMTAAAKELHLTQSGVSQHISTLEEILGHKLFDREQRNLIPTPQAIHLYEKCKRGLNEFESALTQMAGEKELLGDVRIGLPPEYGTTVIIPLVSEFLRKHGQVNVKLHFGLIEETTSKLMSGDLDFAFVDSYTLDKRITVLKVFDEEYGLYASKSYLKKNPAHSKAFYEELDYVEYMEGNAILKSWFQHHLKTGDMRLKVRAYTDSPAAIRNLIVQKVGAGVLPKHMAEEPQTKKQLVEIPGSKKPLVWSIYLAYLDDRTRSKAISELMNHLQTCLAKR